MHIKVNGRTVYITKFWAKVFYVLGMIAMIPSLLAILAIGLFVMICLIPALILFLLSYTFQVH